MSTRTPLDSTASNPGCVVDGSPSVVMVTDDDGVNLFYCEVHDPGVEEPVEPAPDEVPADEPAPDEAPVEGVAV